MSFVIKIKKKTHDPFSKTLKIRLTIIFVSHAKSVYSPCLNDKPPHAQGYPRIDQRTKSYVKTLIGLTGNPQDIPPLQESLKRHHNGDPVVSQHRLNLPPNQKITSSQNIKITE